MGIPTVTALVALLLTFGADESRAASWSYDGERGPQYWYKLFPQACSGKYQSPIDIKSKETLYSPDLKDFAIWYDPPRPGSAMTVSNNGHTIQVMTKGEFYVTNGGLPYVYKTVQFHFHWGHAKHHGSEHLIDGKAYPLELHIVSYNKDLYDDVLAALPEKQGLAVLGVMFQKSEEDNKDLEPLIAAMEQVKDPDEGHQVEIEPLSLRNLLPHDISRYYRYNGSLTTPGCFESVAWTVFAHPKSISARQMRKFREILQPRRAGHHGAHRRRRSPLPADPSSRSRERRALQVLEELALTPQQQARLRRDLADKRAEEVHLRENDAGQAHRKMLDAVHQDAPAHEDEPDDHGEDHGVQDTAPREWMVNNFRPVQPLNDRAVYRSFKLGASHGEPDGETADSGESDEERARRMEVARERLKYYQSQNAATPSLALSASLGLALAGLVASFV